MCVSTQAWGGEGSDGAPGYLLFESGATIEVLEVREPGGWWAGRMVGGAIGWFPSAFCRWADGSAIVPADGAADTRGASGGGGPTDGTATDNASSGPNDPDEFALRKV